MKSMGRVLVVRTANGVFTRSSKRPAIHVYYTFAGSCKHPISQPLKP